MNTYSFIPWECTRRHSTIEQQFNFQLHCHAHSPATNRLCCWVVVNEFMNFNANINLVTSIARLKRTNWLLLGTGRNTFYRSVTRAAEYAYFIVIDDRNQRSSPKNEFICNTWEVLTRLYRWLDVIIQTFVFLFDEQLSWVCLLLVWSDCRVSQTR